MPIKLIQSAVHVQFDKIGQAKEELAGGNAVLGCMHGPMVNADALRALLSHVGTWVMSGPKMRPTPRAALARRPGSATGSLQSTSAATTEDPTPFGSTPPLTAARRSYINTLKRLKMAERPCTPQYDPRRRLGISKAFKLTQESSQEDHQI